MVLKESRVCSQNCAPRSGPCTTLSMSLYQLRFKQAWLAHASDVPFAIIRIGEKKRPTGREAMERYPCNFSVSARPVLRRYSARRAGTTLDELNERLMTWSTGEVRPCGSLRNSACRLQ